MHKDNVDRHAWLIMLIKKTTTSIIKKGHTYVRTAPYIQQVTIKSVDHQFLKKTRQDPRPSHPDSPF